jgi:hypothetical protein
MTTPSPKKKPVKRAAPEVEEKKKEIHTVESMMQAVAQAVNEYFTPEVNAKMSDMTQDHMFLVLRELEGTEYFTAILKFVQLRLLAAQSALNSLDPVANPTAISRQQGAMMGVTEIQNAVITMVASEREAAKEMREINENF